MPTTRCCRTCPRGAATKCVCSSWPNDCRGRKAAPHTRWSGCWSAEGSSHGALTYWTAAAASWCSRRRPGRDQSGGAATCASVRRHFLDLLDERDRRALMRLAGHASSFVPGTPPTNPRGPAAVTEGRYKAVPTRSRTRDRREGTPARVVGAAPTGTPSRLPGSAPGWRIGNRWMRVRPGSEPHVGGSYSPMYVPTLQMWPSKSRQLYSRPP